MVAGKSFKAEIALVGPTAADFSLDSTYCGPKRWRSVASPGSLGGQIKFVAQDSLSYIGNHHLRLVSRAVTPDINLTNNSSLRGFMYRCSKFLRWSPSPDLCANDADHDASDFSRPFSVDKCHNNFSVGEIPTADDQWRYLRHKCHLRSICRMHEIATPSQWGRMNDGNSRVRYQEFLSDRRG